MLDTLTAEHFEPHTGNTIIARLEDSVEIPLTLERVTTNERGRMDPESRLPFSLIFSGPTDRALTSGCCHLQQDGLGTVENVYITRILPQGSNDLAWYQAVFN